MSAQRTARHLIVARLVGLAVLSLLLGTLLASAAVVEEAPGQLEPLWSLQSPKASSPPEVENSAWVHDPLDRFILSRLQAAGLPPAPAASRRIFIRRITFDLTGLPPTPAEIDEFVNHPGEAAYARLVDRLLASPHYGERWGRHWLDVVRYADTAGETADYPVHDAYRYRNYVIDSFNSDKPYDDFIREQIAGDILARDAWERGEISRDQFAESVTATGFLAISRRFGYDTERYEYLTIQDTIDTVGQAVQGLSLGCARCHDHKYDPVTMKDYYALYGIFASTRYAFTGSERLQKVRSFTPLLPPNEALKQWSAWRSELEQLANRIRVHDSKYRLPLNIASVRLTAGLDGDFELQAPAAGGSLGFPANPWSGSGNVRVRGGAQSPFTDVYPKGFNGVSFLAADRAGSLSRGLVPPLTVRNAAHIEFSFDLRCPNDSREGPGTARLFLGRGPGHPAAVELFLGRNELFARNGSVVDRLGIIPSNTWIRVKLFLDLERRTFRGTAGVPGEPAGQADEGTAIVFGDKSFATEWDGTIDSIWVDGQGNLPGVSPVLDLDNFAISTSSSVVSEPRMVAGREDEERPGGPDSCGAEAEPDELVAELKRRVAQVIQSPPFPHTYGVWEGSPHNVRVQERGEPDRPGVLVKRRFLEALGGDELREDNAGSGRRELAAWLTRPTNPLTARVMVNRIWQHHFGHGFVRTENDFGRRGRPPSHPKLLDYLALEFMRSGWSIKAMHRRILLSNTYRLASQPNGRAEEIDPNNVLLSHFPRRRLEAESIRDSLLALSGDLDRSRGGEHPFPAYTRGGFSQHSPFRAEYDSDRRSIYLMTQRLTRHPFLTLFDGPDPNASTPKRFRSTVPTQALFLMNNPFVHSQAAGFARRLLDEFSLDDRARIVVAFKMALGRSPTEIELKETTDFLLHYARELETLGMRNRDRDNETWAAFARSLFARNEFIYVD